MKTHDQILDSLRDFVTRQFPVASKRELASDTPLLSSGIIDSMGTMEVVTFLESEFEILLTDDEMLDGNFETLQSMTDLVLGKLEPTAVETPA